MKKLIFIDTAIIVMFFLALSTLAGYHEFRIRELTAIQEEIQQDTGRATESLQEIRGDVGAARGEIQNLRGELEQIAQMRERLGEFEAKNEQMRKELAAVAAENAGLKKLVTGLELEKLAPFYATGFLCTRSMVPTIDCGDEALWKKKEFLQPEDIAVGEVITFRLPAACKAGENTQVEIAHRVVEIRKARQETIYLTKGDNHLRPDPCWVTFSEVTGLLIFVRKNTRPQDIQNVPAYDKALKEFQEVEAEFQEAQEQYDAKQEEYQAMLKSYYARRSSFEAEYIQLCGFPPDGTRVCTVPDTKFEEMSEKILDLQELEANAENFYQRVVKLKNELQSLFHLAWEAEQKLKEETCKTFPLSC